VLQQVEHGLPVAERCRKLGVSEQTFYRWKKKFGEMEPSEIKKVKQFEDENRRLAASRGGGRVSAGRFTACRL